MVAVMVVVMIRRHIGVNEPLACAGGKGRQVLRRDWRVERCIGQVEMWVGGMGWGEGCRGD